MPDLDLNDVEFFTGRSAGPSELPFATILRKGDFTLSHLSFSKMGEPAAVRLGFSPSKRIIVVEPTQPGQTGSYPVRHQSNGSATWAISAASFCRHHNLLPAIAQRYTPTFKGHTMLIDLNGESIEMRSSKAIRHAPSEANGSH